MDLPRSVFTGGIRTVVDRRLNAVPRADRRLLSVAAIAGRQLNLLVLNRIMRQRHPDLGHKSFEEWLTTCATAAVLAVKDQEWYFAHDKLREGLLINLPLDFRQELHGQIGQAIEEVYENRQPYLAALAYHWGEDGLAAICDRRQGMCVGLALWNGRAFGFLLAYVAGFCLVWGTAMAVIDVDRSMAYLLPYLALALAMLNDRVPPQRLYPLVALSMILNLFLGQSWSLPAQAYRMIFIDHTAPLF